MRDFFIVLSILASYFGEVRSQFEEAGIVPFDANKFGLRLVVKNVDHAWEISHLRFYKDEDCSPSAPMQLALVLGLLECRAGRSAGLRQCKAREVRDCARAGRSGERHGRSHH